MRKTWSIIIASLGLTLLPATTLAQFSGSNGKIFYAANSLTTIMSANADGTGATTIIDVGATVTSAPKLNKAGTKLIYTDGTGIHTVNPDGTGVATVTSDTSDSEPVWSPDGTKIYFSNSGSILSINVDGSSRTTVLASGGNMMYYSPSVSPNGNTITVSGFSTSTSISDIFTIPSAGGSTTNLTNNSSGTNAYYPDYAPDGNTIIFVSDNGSASRVASVPASGGSASVLMSLSYSGASDPKYYNPSYSPDGTKIIVSQAVPVMAVVAPGTIVVANANGTSATSLTALGTDITPGYWGVVLAAAADSTPGLPAAGKPSAIMPWLIFAAIIVLMGTIEIGRRRYHF